MEKQEIRKFFHDMRNSLNTANINIAHLQMNSNQEKAIVDRLESALLEAATTLAEFERKSIRLMRQIDVFRASINDILSQMW